MSSVWGGGPGLAAGLRAGRPGGRVLWSEDATHVMLLGTRRCVSVWEAVERRLGGWRATCKAEVG